MAAKKKIKRRWGDRFDGTLIRHLDGMHVIMPLLYPNRCDNEAYIAETIDLAPIRAYLEKKNGAKPEFKYTMFHIIVAAMIKTLTLRPKLNRFIANRNMYQRNEVSAAFTVKKQFLDEAKEGLAIIHASDDDTMDSLHEQLFKQISFNKKVDGTTDPSSNAMDIVSRIPRPIMKFFVDIIRFLDVHGHCPRGLIKTDPYYTSCVLSNIGSIHLRSGYHHLVNWGTNSLMVLIGEIRKKDIKDENGKVSEREVVDLGMTIDERLAGGYYYSKSIKLLKKILANPELLDAPMSQPVELD